ncbi:MAG: hypothetical protein K1X32_08155, partial [Saprospiraceae bacterium]|nr:hypothetical protein [Saprospiraceae bacterium]
MPFQNAVHEAHDSLTNLLYIEKYSILSAPIYCNKEAPIAITTIQWIIKNLYRRHTSYLSQNGFADLHTSQDPK